MKKIEEYARLIATSMGLNLKVESPRSFVDTKKKISIFCSSNIEDMIIRFSKTSGGVTTTFLRISENKRSGTLKFAFSKNSSTYASMIIKCCGCNNINISKNNREINLFVQDTTDFRIIDNKNYDEKVISANDFCVQDVVNDVCDGILNLDTTELWFEEANEILEYMMPAIFKLITEAKEGWKRRVERKIIELKEEPSVKLYNELINVDEALKNGEETKTYTYSYK